MKVFISSTYTDLIEHRKTAHDPARPTVNRRATNTKPAKAD